jgi:hypothetical protein
MPGASDIPRGNVANIFILQATLSPSSVATITTAEQTFTVNGLLVGDIVQVVKPTAQAGLAVTGARVSALNTLAITFVNPTAGPIVPTASEVYQIKVIRPSGPSPYPTAIT